MLVRMLVAYGESWPEAGGTIDLADHLAQELIERGEAVDADTPQVETATIDGVTETAVKRGPGRPRKVAV